MKSILLLTACGLAALSGCQVSGDRDVDTTRRPSARVEVDAPAATVDGYAMSYTATRDTQWAASTEPNANRGPIRAGERVMLSRTADTSMEWQQARTTDGRLVYVRPADFRMTSSTNR